MTEPTEDTGILQLGSLEQVSTISRISDHPDLPAVSCVTVCHNERLIVGQFLDHYRALGVARFFIVDDRSTDGTFEFLMDQGDVSLFHPVGTAAYKDNVGAWRQLILDRFCNAAWVCLPDLDEFLYFRAMPATLPQVARSLETAAEEALMGIMVDMYADDPIAQQVYDGSIPLTDAFPLFDGQGHPPDGSRISALPRSFVKRFPTPRVCFMGGVRERVFFAREPLGPLKRALLARFSNMRRPLNPTWIQSLQNRATRAVTKSALGDTQLVLNKFALLKWRAGMRFPRGPHSVNHKIRVSESIAAFLHYKFYKGVEGMNYNANREQHAGGAKVYKKMVSQHDVLEKTWVSACTRRFDGIGSLSDIIR